VKALDQQLLDEALGALGELLEDAAPRHYVVCGGSSLLALGLVKRRTTRDVDVLASFEDGKLVSAKPLPEEVLRAVRQVRDELDLLENWFNTGPADDTFFRFGFPDGLEDRLVTRAYGRALRISFIGRRDQVFLKLWAAADSGPGRHVEDLKDLAPTAEELSDAVRWIFRHDDSDGFRLILGQALTALGHDGLLANI